MMAEAAQIAGFGKDGERQDRPMPGSCRMA
jgi:hypothetical protein